MKQSSQHCIDPFEQRRWRLAHGRTLKIGPRAIVMGILNATPDSFSDGGRFSHLDAALEHAAAMAADGAAIIDIGGESTRPDADPVDAAEEQARIIPVIEALAKRPELILSVDTWRAETARLAIRAGAHIVNDVHGLQRDADMARVVAETGSGLVAMHTGRGRERLSDPFVDQRLFLGETLRLARRWGVAEDRIVLDPGFGFAKTPAENLALLSGFSRLHEFGFPMLVGTSRKRFLGRITGKDAERRDAATLASHVMLRQAGAAIFRVHDVASHVDGLAVCDAVRQPALFDLSGDA
ncbi:dihydropteroate synthase [Notoacmeibacter ruber]|uniref:Dihydropteroate synthase n=1 Tax=Notoacmeibacter ruber TaxID=2670375 RepID=A0A3L7JAC1_9HYPH|nr:dihydropteroate synthase [Notoacmeibacter ruber]RLQ87698.1 dihydropteroate synthase [Notoacmeibacter ruber]